MQPDLCHAERRTVDSLLRRKIIRFLYKKSGEGILPDGGLFYILSVAEPGIGKCDMGDCGKYIYKTAAGRYTGISTLLADVYPFVCIYCHSTVSLYVSQYAI